MKKNWLTLLGIFTMFSLASIFSLTSTGTLARLLDTTSATINLSLESGNVQFDNPEESDWVYNGTDKDVYYESKGSEKTFKNVKIGDTFEKTITIKYHGKNKGLVTITPQLSENLQKNWNAFSSLVLYKSEVVFNSTSEKQNSLSIFDTTKAYNSENQPPELKEVTGKISDGQTISIKLTMTVRKTADINFSADMMPKYLIDVQNDLVTVENDK